MFPASDRSILMKPSALIAMLAGLACVVPAMAQSSIGWGNLQWPFSVEVAAGAPTENIYGQVWMPGVTDQTGQGLGITAQLGHGAVGVNPETWTTWQQASYWGDAGNNDEYMSVLIVSTPGSYQYSFRYRYQDEPSWYYAAQRGDLTVTAGVVVFADGFEARAASR
jgi:hypothetical protein